MMQAVVSSALEMNEWDELFVPGTTLSPSDRRIAEQLSPAGRLFVDELTTGVRIRSQSWVGLVRFERFDIRVVPKLADGNARLVQMLAMTGGVRAAWQNEANRTLRAESGRDILDLLSLLLVRECERILSGGVLHDYIEHEEALPVVRGRFLADRQWRKRLGQFHVLECRFDEYESDIDENRLLAFVLGACKGLVRDADLLRRVLSLHEQLASICESDYLDAKALRMRLVYHRLNSHYADAHQLCWLILESMGIADLLASGAVKSNVFLVDMNTLFERFVRRLLEFCVGSTYRIGYQTKVRSILWDANRNRPYSAVIPDFQLFGPEGNLIIDSKYKIGRKLDNSDIYQCFLYAQAFGSAKETPSHSMLVVPSVTCTVEHVPLEVRSAEGISKSVLHLVGVPVAAAVDEIQGNKRGPVCQKLTELVSQAAA